MAFDWFPKNVMVTPVPAPIFNVLLEEIEDVVELKVTLRAIWLLDQKRAVLRTLTEDELLNDSTLIKGVRLLGGNPQERVRQGLTQAVGRGTLLRYAPNAAQDKQLYLLNTDKGRNDLRQLKKEGSPVGQRGELQVPDIVEDSFDQPADTRPNIFALYEDIIGTFGGIMAEELKEAEERYPKNWIAEAFRIAARENKRSWSFVSAILRRWAAEGRSGGRDELGSSPRGNEGRYYGKSGRHTPANNRSRYPKGYQRR